MKTPTYLFSADAPKGKIFDAAVEDMDALAKDGWVDNPAKIGKPVEKAPEKKTQVAKSEDESLGERDLLAIFNAEPTRLTKPELVELGKANGAKMLMVNWKEDTLIKKVREAIDGNN